MRFSAFVVAAIFASALLRSAAAEEASSKDDDQAMIALAVGGFTAIVPIAVGGARAGRNNIDHADRDQGWVFALSGFALAPLTAHLVTGEYARGFAFAAVPAATTIGIGTLTLANVDAIYSGSGATRVAFVVMFAGGAVGGAVGVIDAAFAPVRRRKKRRQVSPASFDVGPGSVGLRGVW